MVLNCDIDGVLRDFNTQVFRVYKKYYPDHEVSATAQEWGFLKYFPIGEKDMIKFVFEDHVDEVFADADPYDKAIPILNVLKYNMHTIQLVTANTEKSLEPTMAWIRKHNVPYDSIHFTRKKTQVKCELAIEDKYETLEVYRHAGVFTVCVDRPWNQKWRPEFGKYHKKNFARIRDYEELYKVIASMGGEVKPLGITPEILEPLYG